MTIRAACAFAGIGERTMRDRRERDPSFDDQVKAALEEFKAQSQVIIAHAGLKQWTARAWLLERRFPEEFGRQRLEVTGAAGGPVGIDSVAIATEMRAAALIRADPEAFRLVSEGIAIAIAAEKKSPA